MGQSIALISFIKNKGISEGLEEMCVIEKKTTVVHPQFKSLIHNNHASAKILPIINTRSYMRHCSALANIWVPVNLAVYYFIGLIQIWN